MDFKLIDALEQYIGFDSHESSMVQELKQFLSTPKNHFDRSCLEGHVTGSAWVLSPDHSKVLLTNHKKLKKWLQLGGHSDGDSNTLDVALREAEEESGIDNIKPISTRIFDVDIHSIPERGKEPEHLHYDINFLLEAPHENFIISEESEDLKWFSVAEMEAIDWEESMARGLKKWKLHLKELNS
ncbi:MAG: NUDIX hydrolase [Bdellovibrionales bacterium]